MSNKAKPPKAPKAPVVIPKGMTTGELPKGELPAKNKVPPPPTQQPPPQQIPESFNARLTSLMSGEAKTKNEMSEYFLQHLHGVSQEIAQISQNIKMLETNLQQTKSRALELKGMQHATVSGLYEWDQIRKIA